MTENALRNIFIVGTVVFMVILVGMTANTLQQVVNVRTPHVTDAVAAGKQVFQSKNCNDCHTILGIGGYFAPDLTKATTRRGSAWLTSWLTNPQAMRPGTTMPNQRLTPDQVTSLVAFAGWVDRVDTNGWPPQPVSVVPAVATTAPAGAQPASSQVAALVQRGGCGACHTIPGIPAAVGTDSPNWCVPARNFQAGKVDRGYLRRAIVDPNADIAPGYKPNVMPSNYGTLFTSNEIDSLVAFIARLDCK